jgi:hypothetical protein
MLALEGSERFDNVSGLVGHKVNPLRIVTAQELITILKGNPIATLIKWLYSGKGRVSCRVSTFNGADINENSHFLPVGEQRILMDDYQCPLDIYNGMAYLCCRPPTPHELETLLHMIMSTDLDWNPGIFDNDIDDVEAFYEATDDVIHHRPFDQYGEYQY